MRLARNGITLRYRTGKDGPPWTVKLPEGSSRAEQGLRAGGFREVEAEVRADGLAGGRLLRAAVGRLKAAGCRAEPPIPKVIRALGP